MLSYNAHSYTFQNYFYCQLCLLSLGSIMHLACSRTIFKFWFFPFFWLESTLSSALVWWLPFHAQSDAVRRVYCDWCPLEFVNNPLGFILMIYVCFVLLIFIWCILRIGLWESSLSFQLALSINLLFYSLANFFDLFNCNFWSAIFSFLAENVAEDSVVYTWNTL